MSECGWTIERYQSQGRSVKLSKAAEQKTRAAQTFRRRLTPPFGCQEIVGDDDRDVGRPGVGANRATVRRIRI